MVGCLWVWGHLRTPSVLHLQLSKLTENGMQLAVCMPMSSTGFSSEVSAASSNPDTSFQRPLGCRLFLFRWDWLVFAAP